MGLDFFDTDRVSIKRRNRLGLISTAGWLLVFWGVILVTSQVQALQISNKISPRNRERPARNSSDYIVLHTTESSKGSSAIGKLQSRGEAHYMVDTNGHVYRIIDKHRVAFHAGRSMWNGRTNLDRYSIGIEVVGFHNKPITAAQTRALKELLTQLQGIYKIPDERVLTHSMVAYGAPNRWHKKSHRGRKRCGMQFATKSMRSALGLTSAPAYDPDVRAGRLINADPYLAQVLYGSPREQTTAVARYNAADAQTIGKGRSAWDVARDQYNAATTLYTFPDGRKLRGNQIRDWTSIPAGTRVTLSGDSDENPSEGLQVVGTDAPNASGIAGDEVRKSTTIYFMPDGRVMRGDQLTLAQIRALPASTRILVGYIFGGYISKNRSAYDICGAKWKHPSTYYKFPDGSIRTGNQINENSIPQKTLVLFSN